MNISYYILPPNAGFKFGTPSERDQFWASLKDTIRVGAEKVGNRTIRLHPSKMKQGFEWAMMTRNGEATAQAVVPPQPPPNVPVTVSAPPTKSDTVTTTNPFDKLASNPTRPLPGLTPPVPREMLAAPTQTTQSSDVPESPVAPVEEVTTSTQPVIEELNTATEIPKEPAVESGFDDPEPADKRTKAYRDWKARQK